MLFALCQTSLRKIFNVPYIVVNIVFFFGNVYKRIIMIKQTTSLFQKQNKFTNFLVKTFILNYAKIFSHLSQQKYYKKEQFYKKCTIDVRYD